jgi:hypothetical protein
MFESKNKPKNVKASESSKCKRTRRMLALIGTMDPGFMVSLDVFFYKMVFTMLQDDKTTDNCHALMVNI